MSESPAERCGSVAWAPASMRKHRDRQLRPPWLPALLSILIHAGVVLGLSLHVGNLVQRHSRAEATVSDRDPIHAVAIVPYPRRPLHHEVQPLIEPVELATSELAPPDAPEQPALTKVFSAEAPSLERLLAELREHVPVPEFAAVALPMAGTRFIHAEPAEPSVALPAEPLPALPDPPTASAPGASEKGTDVGVRALRVPRPTYPEICRRLGQEGTVLLEVEVLPDGSVGNVRVVEASKHRELTEAALQAVRKAAFTPATRHGKPVTALVTIPFRFELLKSDPPDRQSSVQ